MLIGYARVSSSEQETTLQRDALRRAGVRKVYEEKRAGAGVHRVELARMLDALRPGDVVVTYKLDRLARSLRDLLNILDTIGNAGASFRSLTETIDTSTPAGRMVMQMLGAFAEFERGLIGERSRAGQRAAMERGVHCGRAAVLSDKEAARAAADYESQRVTLQGLARRHGCHVSSVKRAIVRARKVDGWQALTQQARER